VSERWEHFAHESDISVRGVGPTLAQAFEQAAIALTAVVTEPGSVRCARTVEIACENSEPVRRLAQCAGVRDGDAAHAVRAV